VEQRSGRVNQQGHDLQVVWVIQARRNKAKKRRQTTERMKSFAAKQEAVFSL
jgi:hypothetical protein